MCRHKACDILGIRNRKEPLPKTNTMTMTSTHERQAQPFAITLTIDEWNAIRCLLTVHNNEPVMSPYVTAKLVKIQESIDKQFD